MTVRTGHFGNTWTGHMGDSLRVGGGDADALDRDLWDGRAIRVNVPYRAGDVSRLELCRRARVSRKTARKQLDEHLRKALFIGSDGLLPIRLDVQAAKAGLGRTAQFH